MKTLKLKSILMLLAFVPLTLWAQEVEKEINKVFNVSAESELRINNSFGDIELQDWDRQEIKIDVKITIEGKNEEYARKALEKIDVKFAQNGNMVMAETENDCNCGNKIQKFSIDYVVRVPRDSRVQLRNSFGDVAVQDRNGPTKIDVQHGDFRLERLSHADNIVELQFGDGEVEGVNGLSAKIQHSDFDGEDIRLLKLNVKFSDVELREVTQLSGGLEVQHSDVNIEVIGKKWDEMNMNVDFSDVDIELRKDAEVRFEIQTSFSDVDVDSGMKAVEKERGMNSSDYRVVVNNDSAPIIYGKLSHSDLNLSWK